MDGDVAVEGVEVGAAGEGSRSCWSKNIRGIFICGMKGTANRVHMAGIKVRNIAEVSRRTMLCAYVIIRRPALSHDLAGELAWVRNAACGQRVQYLDLQRTVKLR